MDEDQGKGIYADQVTDDSYWAALFQLEDSLENEIGSEPPQSPFDLRPEEAPETPFQDNGRLISLTALPLPESSDPWEVAQACMRDDQVQHLTVTGHNKGGLLVVWNGIQGFVPASQLINFPKFHVPRERLQSLADWHDRKLQLKIIEVNKSQSRLIFSERATLVAAEQKELLLNGVRDGEIREGSITNLTEFGAFVDLGGVEGLVHKSEISWSRVAHPSDVLQPGQSIRALVLSIDPKAERIALSMKRLRPDPWLTAQERYQAGQRVRGVVGNIMSYGAFVILEEELEGLVHFSELAEGVFMHPRDVVQSGEEVVARVLAVDGLRKRIALSLRGLGADTALRT